MTCIIQRLNDFFTGKDLVICCENELGKNEHICSAKTAEKCFNWIDQIESRAIFSLTESRRARVCHSMDLINAVNDYLANKPCLLYDKMERLTVLLHVIHDNYRYDDSEYHVTPIVNKFLSLISRVLLYLIQYMRYDKEPEHRKLRRELIDLFDQVYMHESMHDFDFNNPIELICCENIGYYRGFDFFKFELFKDYLKRSMHYKKAIDKKEPVRYAHHKRMILDINSDKLLVPGVMYYEQVTVHDITEYVEREYKLEYSMYKEDTPIKWYSDKLDEEFLSRLYVPTRWCYHVTSSYESYIDDSLRNEVKAFVTVVNCLNKGCIASMFNAECGSLHIFKKVFPLISDLATRYAMASKFIDSSKLENTKDIFHQLMRETDFEQLVSDMSNTVWAVDPWRDNNQWGA